MPDANSESSPPEGSSPDPAGNPEGSDPEGLSLQGQVRAAREHIGAGDPETELSPDKMMEAQNIARALRERNVSFAGFAIDTSHALTAALHGKFEAAEGQEAATQRVEGMKTVIRDHLCQTMGNFGGLLGQIRIALANHKPGETVQNLLQAISAVSPTCKFVVQYGEPEVRQLLEGRGEANLDAMVATILGRSSNLHVGIERDDAVHAVLLLLSRGIRDLRTSRFDAASVAVIPQVPGAPVTTAQALIRNITKGQTLRALHVESGADITITRTGGVLQVTGADQAALLADPMAFLHPTSLRLEAPNGGAGDGSTDAEAGGSDAADVAGTSGGAGAEEAPSPDAGAGSEVADAGTPDDGEADSSKA